MRPTPHGYDRNWSRSAVLKNSRQQPRKIHANMFSKIIWTSTSSDDNIRHVRIWFEQDWLTLIIIQGDQNCQTSPARGPNHWTDRQVNECSRIHSHGRSNQKRVHWSDQICPNATGKPKNICRRRQLPGRKIHQGDPCRLENEHFQRGGKVEDGQWLRLAPM